MNVPIFSYAWVSIIWKTQNTVSGYKKRSKIQSHEIFWSAIPELWVVSFGTFASWPFYRRKSWETQNTVFGYKKESKFNPTRFSDSLPQILCCFMLVFSQNHFLRITEKYGSLTCFHYNISAYLLKCDVFFFNCYAQKVSKPEITVLGYKKRSKSGVSNFCEIRIKS